MESGPEGKRAASNMRAQTLFKVGFTDLVSVIPPDGELAPASTIDKSQRGKVPGRLGGEGWYGYAWDNDHGPELAAEIDESGANVGIRGRRFPGLDLDTESEEVTEAVMALAFEHLGKAPVRRSRGPRRLLMYRSEEPFKKQSIVLTDPEGQAHTVEMLGDRRQYLIHGMHPSGERYRWDEFWQPFKLTAITEDQTRAFFEAVSEHFVAEGFTAEITGGGKKAATAEPVPDEITAGARNATLASIAGTFRQRNIGREAALAALQEENRNRCSPPLSEGEVERILDSIYTNYEAGPDIVIVPAEDEFEADPTLEAPPAAKPKKERPVFTMRRAGDLAESQDEEELWLVDGVLPMRGSSILGAKPKVGKSTLARALAAAVVKGRAWVNYETRQGTVFYFRFPGEGTTQEARQEWRALGVDPDADLWDIEVHKPHEIHEHLERLVAQYQPVLIVIDTLQHFIKAGDLDDYAKVHAALSPIHDLAEGAHVMCLHHSPKGDRADMADAFLGSTALFGAAEVGMLLARDKDDQTTRVWQVRGRGVEIPPTVVGLDPNTHEPYMAGSLIEHQMNRTMARVMSVLAEHDARSLETGMLRQDLLDLVSGKTEAIRRAIKKLKEGGAIMRERDRALNGAPYMHWLTAAGDEFLAEERSDE